MARIRQVRDVINARQQEDQKRSLTYKEIEVQAVVGAVHAAAGNQRGAKSAQKFRFHKEAPATPSVNKLTRLFPAASGPQGIISNDDIAAEAARMRGGQ